MGLTLVLRRNLLVYFGDDSRPHAKWLSLARVLADPSSAGASYIDVRLPERPAAGFAPGAMPALSSGTSANASPGEEGASGEPAASGGARPLAEHGSASQATPAGVGPSSGEQAASGERAASGEHSSSGESPSPGFERSSAPAEGAAGAHG